MCQDTPEYPLWLVVAVPAARKGVTTIVQATDDYGSFMFLSIPSKVLLNKPSHCLTFQVGRLWTTQEVSLTYIAWAFVTL